MSGHIDDLRGAARGDSARWRQELAGRNEAPGHRTHVVATFTPHRIVPALGLGRLDVGSPTDVSVADVNQLFQIALDPAAHGIEPDDDVVVLWRIEDAFERDMHAWTLGEDGALAALEHSATSLGGALASLAGRQRGTLVVSDAPTPVGFGFDHRDSAESHDLGELARGLSTLLVAALGDAPNIEVLRWSALQAASGIVATFDQAGWMLYRQPLVDWYAHLVGADVAALLAARVAAPPKVIVLDCDGTLWDGIAVDDGIGGLRCDDAFPGRAHQEFQRAVQRLRARGIMLAVSSKNDPETVAEAFAQVDGMVLTDADIAARRVSWNPKPNEIAEIIAELNIGADSVVFVDDSPFEIGSVREQFAAVRCLQVPDDIELLPDLLATTGWFRHLRVNDDDRRRTEMVQAEAARTAAAPAMSNDQFLASLELRVDVFDVDDANVDRATQLINKSNQFNLTTIRRDRAAVAELATSDDVRVLAASVTDRFGDYGVIGVMIGRRDPDADTARWDIDTFVMSCRVLGRGVETAMLAMLVARLRLDGADEIVGTFVPTDRNARVAELYAEHRFVEDAVLPDSSRPGARIFRVGADRSVQNPDHITARWLAPSSDQQT